MGKYENGAPGGLSALTTPTSDVRRRRGRDTHNLELLVERETERSVIEQQLNDARDGIGSVVVLEGPAGKGKSRLLDVAGELAHRHGLRVLEASGTELERHFPFGLAIQLFEPWWLAADESERAATLSGAAGAAGALLEQGPGGAESDAGYAAVHGLFRLTAQLAAARRDEDGPTALVILVDDAQWADGPSLRFLAYLAERLADLPIALVVSMRPGEPCADAKSLGALRVAAGDRLLRLQSLSAPAVQEVVRAELPEADDAFCAACARITGGNPFLLLELLEQVRADALEPNAETAGRLGDLAPNAVLDAMVARLGAMPAAVRSVALAVAVLGDGTTLRHVAELTRLAPTEAAPAADALAGMHLLCPGEPLSFVHPLIRQAVQQSISPLARGHEHARAAEILKQDGQSAELIAPHLLAAPAQADPETVTILRTAAHTALASGAVTSAVGLLHRALDEGAREDRADLLAELAQAEVQAGLPQAVARLSDAIEVCEDPKLRAELSLTLGAAHYRDGDYGDAVTVLAGAMLDTRHDDAHLTEEIAAAHFSALALVPALVPETQRRGARLLASLSDPPTPPEHTAVAHLAVHQAVQCAPRSEVRRVADLAWGDGELLETDGFLRSSWSMVAGALHMVDELERSLELCDAALAHAGAREATEALAIANHCRAWLLYERGEITAAGQAARAAVDALPAGRLGYLPPAYAAIACCHIQQGSLSEAECALAVIEHPELHCGDRLPALLATRAELRLAQRRPQEALDDAVEAGRLWETELGPPSPGALPWRAIAATAHLALGQPDLARDLASDELVLARELGVTRAIIRDLCVLGLVEGGDDGIALLAEAVSLGAEHPPRLAHISALIALGGALRRANQRAAARDPLTAALKLCQQAGATALALEAETELAVTGSRRRSESLWGPEALTPSERRVAELAVDGLTTREMAESLFVTPKTVEFHLRHIYQKLGVNSRDKLSAALGIER
jgi:DNA-binding CsgD family transcriptional regulator